MSGMEASFALAIIGVGVAFISFPFFIEGLKRTAKILVGAALTLMLPLALRLLVLAVLS